MQEAWRTYLELATGLGDASRKRVKKVVKDVVGRGNATADQVRSMTSDLLATNSANREALVKLVKVEVDRALGRVGLATMDEVDELTARVRDLEHQLKEAKGGAATETTTASRRPSKAARSAAASKATAKSAKSTVAKKTVAKKTTAKKTTAKKTTAKKTTAPRATAAKATPVKATVKRAPGRKAQP